MFVKIVQARNRRMFNLNEFQAGVRFSIWSRNLKLLALVKIVGQRVPHHLGLQFVKRNVYELLTFFCTLPSTVPSTKQQTSGTGFLGFLFMSFIPV